MKNWVSIFLLPTLLLGSVAACGQIPDSTQNIQSVDIQQDTLPKLTIIKEDANTDSTKVKKRGFLYRTFKEDYPNPNKALYLSLAVPGGGQFYNRRWWKIPIIYGGYAALIYSARFNASNYRLLRDAVISEFADEDHPFSNSGLSVTQLQTLRDQYDKRRQLSYIGIFALHLIQTAEAFVDCHLKTFDISDDLSLRVGPSIQATPNTVGFTPGVGFSLVIK